MFARRLSLVLTALWLCTLVGAAPAAVEPGSDPVAILDDALRASGIRDPEMRREYTARFAAARDTLAAEAGDRGSPYRRARRLHRAAHRTFLRSYVESADGLESVLDHGEFNCVSATLFFGLVARSLGYDVRVVERPRHVSLRLLLEDQAVDVEVTSARGFDPGAGRTHPPGRGSGPAAAGADDGVLGRFPGAGDETQAPVVTRLEEAVAYLWHNAARRALARGESLRAAESFREEFRLLPDLALRSEALSNELAQAFRIEYDAGRFVEAQRIAEIDVEIFPGRTTGTDRLLAATLKRVEDTCDAGEPAAAAEELERLYQGSVAPADVARLEREACPRIAAEAVRLGDWDLAIRMAACYARVERDPVESDRLFAWIEGRRSGDRCVPPRRISRQNGSRTLRP